MFDNNRTSPNEFLRAANPTTSNWIMARRMRQGQLASFFAAAGIAAYTLYDGVSNFSSWQAFSNFISTNWWQAAVSGALGAITPRVASNIRDGLEIGGYLLSRLVSGSNSVAISDEEITQDEEQQVQLQNNPLSRQNRYSSVVDLEAQASNKDDSQSSLEDIAELRAKVKPGTKQQSSSTRGVSKLDEDDLTRII